MKPGFTALAAYFEIPTYFPNIQSDAFGWSTLFLRHLPIRPFGVCWHLHSMEFVWSQHRLDNAEAWLMVGSIDFEGAMMLFRG